MQYTRAPYPQLHGAFDPHVSILDALANLGPACRGRAGIARGRRGATPLAERRSVILSLSKGGRRDGGGIVMLSRT